MTETIRVVIVDDQELVRAGLRPLAERDGDISVIAEAADGRSGLSHVRETGQTSYSFRVEAHMWKYAPLIV